MSATLSPPVIVHAHEDGETSHQHEHGFTDGQKQQLRSDATPFPKAVAVIQELRNATAEETKSGIPENPHQAHQALGKADLVFQWLPEIARDSAVPQRALRGRHHDGLEVAQIPGAGREGRPAVVMTLQKHLGVSDHYSGRWMMRTDDLGQTWTGPTEIPELAWVTEPGGVVRAVADVTPGWHPLSGKFIAMGCTVRYGKQGEQLSDVQRFSQTAYAVYAPKTGTWSKWQILELPAEDKFNMARNACAQWLVLPDGTPLVPIYFAKASQVPASVTVLHCAFDGQKLTYVKHGDELSLNIVRGLCEPSMIAFRDRFYLTIRNDIRGYVTVSNDGLHYQPMKSWTFDDGSELGSFPGKQLVGRLRPMETIACGQVQLGDQDAVEAGEERWKIVGIFRIMPR